MKGPLRAIRRYGAHVALILLIVLLGIYWLREPSLDQAEELIKEGKYADARALLDRFQKSEHDLDQPDRGRMRWLLAELILLLYR